MDKGRSDPALFQPDSTDPVYKKWWLWTIVGLVVAGGAVGWGWFDPASGSADANPFIEVKWQ